MNFVGTLKKPTVIFLTKSFDNKASKFNIFETKRSYAIKHCFSWFPNSLRLYA